MTVGADMSRRKKSGPAKRRATTRPKKKAPTPRPYAPDSRIITTLEGGPEGLTFWRALLGLKPKRAKA